MVASRETSDSQKIGDWEPAVFERHGQELLAVIREHFESIRKIPVAAPCDTSQLVASLSSILPENGEDFSRILTDTRNYVIPNLVQWNHPFFYGYFPTCASFPGILAETLTASLNINAMLWKTGPAASALEQVVLRWMAEMVGYPEGSDSVLVNGASLATLYALAAARDAAIDFDVREQGMTGASIPTLRIYASDQAHSSVGKAAITLGLGLANLVRVPSDEQYRMCPDLLEEAIRRDIDADAMPVAVVATVGTTSVAAADPLGPIADICARYRIWLHVDAAYGGFYSLSSKLQGQLQDLAVGDSLIVNPQKTLFVPLEATALYCRRRDVLANTFRLVPEYLTSTHDGDGQTFDYMDLSPQLGRSFRALKLWWVIRSFGRSGLASRLDYAVELADWLRETVRAHPDWRCPASSPYPLVCLRYEPRELLSNRALTDEERREELDKLNARILAAVNAAGSAFLSHSMIREGYIMRVSIGNIHTTRSDVEHLWGVVTQTAEAQLANYQPTML